MEGSETHVQINLKPGVNSPRYAISNNTFSLPESVGFQQISHLLRQMLEDQSDDNSKLEFDFYHNGKIVLCKILKDLIALKNISQEMVIELIFRPKLAKLPSQKPLNHKNWIKSIDCDHRYIVTGCYDKKVYVWGTDKGKCGVAELNYHRNAVGAVSLVSAIKNDEDSVRLISSDDSACMYYCMLNPKTSSSVILASFHGHTNVVKATSISPSQSKFASCSFDRTIKLWSLAGIPINSDSLSSSNFKAVPVATLCGHDKAVYSVTWCDESKLVSGSPDMTMKIWDVPTFALLHSIEINRPINCVAVDPFSKNLTVCGNFDGSMTLCDIRAASSGSSPIVDRITNGHSNQISSVSFSPNDQNYFISSGFDRWCLLWDLRNLKNSLRVFHKDGRILCSAWKNGLLYLGGDDNLVSRIYSDSLV